MLTVVLGIGAVGVIGATLWAGLRPLHFPAIPSPETLQRMISLAEEAQRTVEGMAPGQDRSHALYGVARLWALAGRPEEAVRALEAARAVPAAPGGGREISGLMEIIDAMLWAGEREAVHPLLAEAIQLVRAEGTPSDLARLVARAHRYRMLSRREIKQFAGEVKAGLLAGSAEQRALWALFASKELAGAGMTGSAFDLALTVEDPAGRDRVYEHMVDGLVEHDRAAEIRRVSRRFTHPEARARSYWQAVRLLVRFGKSEQAAETARRFAAGEHTIAEIPWLLSAAEAMAGVHRPHEMERLAWAAYAAAAGIADRQKQSYLLSRSIGLIARADPDRALALAREAPEGNARIDAMRAVAFELAARGRKADALLAAVELRGPSVSQDLLMEASLIADVGIALARAGKDAEARAALDEAQQLVSGEDISVPGAVAERVALALALMGGGDEAIQVLDGLAGAPCVMEAMAKAMQEAPRAYDAVAILTAAVEPWRIPGSPEEEFRRALGLSVLARLLVEAAEVDLPLAIAREIGRMPLEPSLQPQFLRNIADPLVHAGRVREAIDVARLIRDLSERIWTLEDLSDTVARGWIYGGLPCEGD